MSTLVFLGLKTAGLDPERHHIWEIGAIVRGHPKLEYDGQWHWMLRPHLQQADPIALKVGGYYERAGNRFGFNDVEAWRLAGPEAFHDPDVSGPVRLTRMDIARDLAMILDGAHIVGAVPSFDDMSSFDIAAHMARFLRAHRQCPTWHHHLLDVQALAVGYLAGTKAGYNNSVEWLAEYHNNPGTSAAAACTVPKPELDQVELPALPWSSDELSRRVGVEPPGADERHTALGDARWAMAIYDRVMGAHAPAMLAGAS